LIIFRAPCKLHLNLLRQNWCGLAPTDGVCLSVGLHSKNCISQLHSILAGVPQGSLLVPLLFNNYLNGIPTTDKTQLAIYIDDTAVLYSSPLADTAMRRLQSHADDIENYCEKRRLQINANKCEVVLFASKSSIHRILVTITLNGTAVPLVPHVKYLGIYLDKYLTWQQHIKFSTTKAYRPIGMLYSLFQNKSKVNQDTAIII
jgi:hypothetical protein